jgi:hypothetical protein
MTDTPDATPRWEIAGHNGIFVNGETGETWTDLEFAKKMRTVSIERDATYAEFAVQKTSAKQLADYLNTLEAELVEERQARSDEQEATLRLAASQQRYVAELAALREKNAELERLLVLVTSEGKQWEQVKAELGIVLTPQKPEEAP